MTKADAQVQVEETTKLCDREKPLESPRKRVKTDKLSKERQVESKGIKGTENEELDEHLEKLEQPSSKVSGDREEEKDELNQNQEQRTSKTSQLQGLKTQETEVLKRGETLKNNKSSFMQTEAEEGGQENASNLQKRRSGDEKMLEENSKKYCSKIRDPQMLVSNKCDNKKTVGEPRQSAYASPVAETGKDSQLTNPSPADDAESNRGTPEWTACFVKGMWIHGKTRQNQNRSWASKDALSQIPYCYL